MLEKKLGKIQSVKFGIGGYQDTCFGIFFIFSSKDWCCGSSEFTWDPNCIKHTDGCSWNETERSNDLNKIMRYISDLLRDAKVDDVTKLCGKPVEVVFENTKVQSWRILTEVL